MRIVIQRVTEAQVVINSVTVSAIQKGLVVLLGIEDIDSKTDADYLIQKLSALRIFSDAQGAMNFSVRDIGGSILVVSQFTLFADTKKGNRPSFLRAARPEKAIPLYEYFVEKLRTHSECSIQTGEFGADMKVSLVNDGPVTIIIDSLKN